MRRNDKVLWLSTLTRNLVRNDMFREVEHAASVLFELCRYPNGCEVSYKRITRARTYYPPSPPPPMSQQTYAHTLDVPTLRVILSSPTLPPPPNTNTHTHTHTHHRQS
jgi:hypothetical protein